MRGWLLVFVSAISICTYAKDKMENRDMAYCMIAMENLHRPKKFDVSAWLPRHAAIVTVGENDYLFDPKGNSKEIEVWTPAGVTTINPDRPGSCTFSAVKHRIAADNDFYHHLAYSFRELRDDPLEELYKKDKKQFLGNAISIENSCGLFVRNYDGPNKTFLKESFKEVLNKLSTVTGNQFVVGTTSSNANPAH